MFKKMIIIAAMALLSLTAQIGTASANLVDNGNFTSYSADNLSATNWTSNGSFLFFDKEAIIGSGTISQSIGTTAGQEYRFSFSLANDLPGFNSFQTLWNGKSAQSISNIIAFNTQYSFLVNATAATTDITFIGQNNDSVFHLNNVDVTPTPIPAAFWLLGSGLAGLVGIRRRS
jgi:hypothetical protein